MRYNRRFKTFPDSCKKEDNPLANLYALRLLVNSRLWKQMDTGDFEQLACYIPALGEVIYRCNQLTAFYECSKEDDDDKPVRRKMRWSDEEDSDMRYDSADCFCDRNDLPSNVYARFNRLKPFFPEGFSIDDLFNKTLQEFEQSALKTTSAMPEVFSKNLDLVCELYGLDSTDIEVFRFLIYLKLDTCLQLVANTVDYSHNTLSLLTSLISRATLQREEKIYKAVSEEGNLVKTGRITLDIFDRSPDVEDKLEFSFKRTISSFTTRALDKRDLQEDFMKPAAAGKLTLDDFKHIPEVQGQIIPMLENAIQNRKIGCNILLYGKSGTGKSELTRTVSKHLGLRLFSVGNEDEGKNRIAALRTSDKFLSKALDTLLVIDECDDIFNSGFNFFSFLKARTNKGQITEALESNSRPTFWTCNDIAGMDDAILRRFDIILEMPKLTPQLRKKVFKKQLGSGFSRDFLRALSENEDISFAMLDRAVSIASTFNEKSQKQKECDIVGLLNQTLKAQKGRPIHITVKKKHPYDATSVNTSVDLIALANNLKKTDRATICLYGAPGTGKSAYVHWLAKQLNRPLVI